MEASRLAALAFKHAVNAAAEEVYLHTGHDYTKPVTFYAFVNEHCNVKCRYCEFWRLKHYVKEMTIDEWKNALASVKDFVGDFSINFSGGEPFIKPGFIDLLAWCNANGISAGVTTNGSALTPRNAAKIVASNPFNVNISVDWPTGSCTIICAAMTVCSTSFPRASAICSPSASVRARSFRSPSSRR